MARTVTGKRRGRPPGSKNKVAPAAATPTVVPPRMAEPTGDSLQDARAHLAQVNATIEAAQVAGALTKELAALFAQKTVLLRFIAAMTSAYSLTESKIVRSEPFIRMMSEFERVLEQYPDAVRALKVWKDSYQ